MRNLYIIGGSPCSGKSTIAEALAKSNDFYYFKVDDHLEAYTKRGLKENLPICKKQFELSPDQIWMRNPILQCDEEIQFYEEIFQFIEGDLNTIDADQDVIAEGAAFLPQLVKRMEDSCVKYMAITPSREFQIAHYKEREWIPYVLEGCSDKEKAFDNWMERDCLFAWRVGEACVEENYELLINNGNETIDDLVHKVSGYFNLVD